MSSVSLTRTNGTPTSQRTFTISLWYKKNAVRDYGASSQDGVIFNTATDGNNRLTCLINQETSPYDQVRLVGINSASSVLDIRTSARLKDVSGWYHIVAKVDTTQATASDRAKIYINGVEQSLDISTYPSQNTDLNVTANPFLFSYSGGGNYLEGSVAHYHYCDGYAYDASTFGQSNSNGVWTPITAPSVTYGTNGFFLKFENSGSMGTDSSPNGNNFTVSGTFTKSLDTPSNVYATWNSLKEPRIVSGTPYSPTYSNGGFTATHPSGTFFSSTVTTLGVNKGKWYLEVKANNTSSADYLGLIAWDAIGENPDTYTYHYNGNFGGGTAYGSSWQGGDIISIAFDADNGTLWFAKNGTWQNSATQSEIENGTTTNSAITGLDMSNFWVFGNKSYNGSYFQLNTGTGFFGTTAVSTPTTDGVGEAIFEYTVPSGYYALNTKNLATYG